MYNSLVWNPDGDILEPDAAESWEVSADGLTWTFLLRDNIRFQGGYTPVGPRDGTLMTSADVKYNLGKMMGLVDGVTSPRSGWMKEFIDTSRPDLGLEVIDQLTLHVHLNRPFAAFPSVLALGFSAIYPDGTSRTDLMDRPYGSGPFRLKSATAGVLWEYERNNDYFKPGLPYLDEVHHVNISDQVVSQAAFLTGQVDLLRDLPTVDNEPIFDQLVDQGDIVMRPYNTQCRPQRVLMNVSRPPFDNPRLREAVNLVIDRQAYIDVVHGGNATAHLYLDTGGWGRSEADIWQLPGYRLPKAADLAAAQDIIAQEYPGGLQVNMIIRGSSGYILQGDYIASLLRQTGMDVTLEVLDTATFFGRVVSLDYELFGYWFCQTPGTPTELFGSYLTTGGSRNWSSYTNFAVDTAYLDMAGTMDPALRRQKALDLEDLILADMPIAPLPVQDSFRSSWSYV